LADDLTRDKLVSCIAEDKVHEKLLGIKDLTLVKAIDMLKTDQIIKFRAKNMASATTEESSTFSAVNKISQKNKDKDNPAKDKNRRTRNPISSKQQHPIDGTQCKFCGK